MSVDSKFLITDTHGKPSGGLRVKRPARVVPVFGKIWGHAVAQRRRIDPLIPLWVRQQPLPKRLPLAPVVTRSSAILLSGESTVATTNPRISSPAAPHPS